MKKRQKERFKNAMRISGRKAFWQNVILCLMSAGLMIGIGQEYALLILALIVGHWYLGLRIDRERVSAPKREEDRKKHIQIFLLAAIIPDMLLLVYSIVSHIGEKRWEHLFPIGVIFCILRGISYVIDIGGGRGRAL